MNVDLPKEEMRWYTSLSKLTGSQEATAKVIEDLEKQLQGATPDLLCAFVSSHHAASYELVSALLNESFPDALLFGCSASAVIGGGDEVEQRPGISVTAAVLPNVDLNPFHLLADDFPDDDADVGVWQGLLGCRAADNPHFILLPEPYSVHPVKFLQGLDRVFPEGTKVGGLASGAEFAGGNVLYLGTDIFREGVVGIALTGDIQIDTVVAQGCRPLGAPMFVTKCKGNILFEIDGKSSIHVLNELYETLDATDRALFQTGLLVGVVMREMEEEYRRGDFLIRNIIGLDPSAEAIALGTALHENQVIQFHVRDASTSTEDLTAMMNRHVEERGGNKVVAGALMFSCMGRGQDLYGVANHDSEVFREVIGEVPVSGFFCNGEIGPVRGSTFLHGYTSAFGLFREKDAH